MEWRESDLPLMRSQGRPEYQVMIDYIKDQVGEGRVYANDLVRVVLSDRGCYYEFRDLPEEFSGAVGSGFRYQFCGTREGREVFDSIYKIALAPETADTHEISLMAIYDWDGLLKREDIFVYHWSRRGGTEEGPLVVGAYRPGVLPIFFKLKVDSDLAEPLLGVRKGVLFFVANLSDQHLLVRIPHHGPGVTDLNEASVRRTVH